MLTSGSIAGISFGMALLVILYIPIYNLIAGCNSSRRVFWITFILWGWLVNFAGNAIIQSTACENVDYSQITFNALTIPTFMLIFAGISFIPFFSTAVEKALPLKIVQVGPQEVGAYTIAYYIFWAALFGQMISGGISSACPK
jgi:hypothetical protein